MYIIYIYIFHISDLFYMNILKKKDSFGCKHLHVSSTYPTQALGGSGAPAASDAAAMRAARLAALEKRGA